MTTRTHRRNFFGRGIKRERMLRKLANMRAAKAKKRAENPSEREPKMVRYYPLSFGIRDDLTGEEAWVKLRSVRDMSKRVAVVLRYYSAGRK